jgi:hypothetical protein
LPEARQQMELGVWAVLALLLVLGIGGCSSGAHPRPQATHRPQTGSGAQAQLPGANTRALTRTSTSSAVPSVPVMNPPSQLSSPWQVVLSIDGESAAWAAQRSGVTLVRFDQRLVHLVLHPGSSEPEG